MFVSKNYFQEMKEIKWGLTYENDIFTEKNIEKFEFEKNVCRSTSRLKIYFLIFIPESPHTANGPRPLAALASVASVGAALCLKIHFFFR